MDLTRKCNFMERAFTLAEREFGCPLDHCACGTHDVENKEHECEIDEPPDLCPRCGSDEFKDFRGYVGETITICATCDSPVWEEPVTLAMIE